MRCAKVLPFCGRTPRCNEARRANRRCPVRWQKPVTTLTYIFIGILTILIYADDICGVDHNMLLIDRAWATPKSAVSELVRAFCGRLRSIRTLATKCCHNDLQRNRQGRGSAEAYGSERRAQTRGIGGRMNVRASHFARNNDLTRICINLQNPGGRSSGSVVLAL